MRGCPRRRNAVAVRRLQVRRRVKTSQVRRPRRRHRRILMRATRPHLNQRAAIGSRHHTGSRRGYRRIRIHDGQNHRLQNHALGKRAAHRQDRRMRKIQIPLAVTINMARKMIIPQVIQRRVIQERQVGQLFFRKHEVLHRAQHTRRARHHAVSTLVRQPAGKNLKRTRAMRRPIRQRRLQHGQLVLIRQQRT